MFFFSPMMLGKPASVAGGLFPELDPSELQAAGVITNGTRLTTGTNYQNTTAGTGLSLNTGKWYIEARLSYGNSQTGLGVSTVVGAVPDNLTASTTYTQTNSNDGFWYAWATGAGVLGAWDNSSPQVFGMAIDADTGSVWFAKDGTWVGDPAAGTGATYTGISTPLNPFLFVNYTNSVAVINFGQDSTFDGSYTKQGNADANGYGDFYYAPPSGFLAACSDNGVVQPV